MNRNQQACERRATRRDKTYYFVNARNSGRLARPSVGGALCVRGFSRRLRDGSYLKIKL